MSSRQRNSSLAAIVLALLVAAAPSFASQKNAAPSTGPVNLNAATEKQLVDLPGIGKATAAKIIAGRPYASVNDLSRAGVSAKEIQTLSTLVTVGAAAPAPKATPVAPAAAPAPAPVAGSSSAVRRGPQPAAVPQVPPQAGMVWVNLETKVFHRSGDPWYGATKRGKFMTEADATAAGYHEAKQASHKPAAKPS
jgi:hypothetical protein